MAAASRRYCFAPRLCLSVTGPRSVQRHFAAEYGPASASPGKADLNVAFGDPLPPATHGAVADGHKTVRWQVVLSDPDATPLRAWIRVRGRPRSFALSLVQGYVVEPLLSVAAAPAGHVLVPGAAVVGESGALLLLGRSRSGKSTVTAEALASGREILGDDQVVIESSGRCFPFPRRLRVYSDLAETAPAAYARLSPRIRAALVGRRFLKRVSRGYVAPPVRFAAGELGGWVAREPRPLARIAVIERSATVAQLTVAEARSEWAVEQAGGLLREQRARLASVLANGWRAALEEASAREQATLRDAFEDTPVVHIRIPTEWHAARAIRSLSDWLARAEAVADGA